MNAYRRQLLLNAAILQLVIATLFAAACYCAAFFHIVERVAESDAIRLEAIDRRSVEAQATAKSTVKMLSANAHLAVLTDSFDTDNANQRNRSLAAMRSLLSWYELNHPELSDLAILFARFGWIRS